MVVFIIWKLEWLKVIFKLTSKREVVTALLEYNCFDYLFQVLFVNVTVWISLWILTLFSALNISVNTTHPEIVDSQSLNVKIKLIGRAMKLFWKSHWSMKYLPLWSPALQNIFWKICKTLRPPSYILNVHRVHVFLKVEFTVFKYQKQTLTDGFLKLACLY